MLCNAELSWWRICGPACLSLVTRRPSAIKRAIQQGKKDHFI
jgi:hypothetical protein